MKIKNFLLAGIAGGITDYLLGWLFYGILFMDYFGGNEPTHMEYIALGCLSFGFLISYIFVRWSSITTFKGGLKAGAGIGFIMGLMNNFFEASMASEPVDWQKFTVHIMVSVVMAAIVGGVVGAVNGTSDNKSA